MRRALAPAILALALAAGGCGLGPGKQTGGASITVTRDFGAQVVGRASDASVREEDTVMRFLQRRFRTRTRYGGGFVQAIDGLAGGTQGGRPVDWFYYVNGIEAARGATSTTVHAGDRIWWDRHDWGVTMRIPAVVGSFPEPFRSGSGGRRLPVRLECAPDTERACGVAAARLRAAGVPPARGVLGSPSAGKLVRLLVGRWPALRAIPSAQQIEAGPRTSGVFARIDAGGRRLAVLDPRGRVALRLAAGSGLVAAVRSGGGAPTWVVTGTDDAGLLAAARALRPAVLANRFALALAPGGRPVPAPEPGA
jgi:Domain of unknown function (DUF4430)